MLFSIGGGLRTAHGRKMVDPVTFVTCDVTRASAFVTGVTFNAAAGALGRGGLRFLWTSRICLLD